MEVLVSILVGVLIIEGYVWLPNFSKWLLEQAVCQVHVEERERCREEWNAALDARPNSISKLSDALSLFIAAYRINADFLEAKREECAGIDKRFEDLASRHRRLVAHYSTFEIQRGSSQEDLKRTVNELLSSVKSCEPPSRNTDEQPSDSLSSAFERLCGTVVLAAHRAWGLSAVSVDSARSRLDQLDGLLKSVSKKRAQIAELLNQENLSSDNLAVLVRSITDDLDVIGNAFEDDRWGDDEAIREQRRIAAVLDDIHRKIQGSNRNQGRLSQTFERSEGK